MQLRSNLKALADAKGASIRQVAHDIDYRFESVRQMYNDEMERYPRELLAKLCAYFNVTPAELFVLTDNTPEPHDN